MDCRKFLQLMRRRARLNAGGGASAIPAPAVTALYLPFNDDFATAYANGEVVSPGTVNNGNSLSTSAITYKNVKCCRVGNAMYIANLALPADWQKGSFCFTIWVNVTDSSSQKVIVGSKIEVQPWNGKWTIWFGSGTGTGGLFFEAIPVTRDDWHFIMLGYDATGKKAYARYDDQQKEVSCTYGQGDSSISLFSQNGNNQFTGYASQFRFFTYMPTADQINALRNELHPVK